MLAGGYGSFRGPRGVKISKVTAMLGGKPIVRHIFDNLESTGLFAKYYVVTNTTYHSQIERALHGCRNVHYTTQPYRLGTAGAVALALRGASHEEEHVVIVYGDMPLWRRETFHLLVNRHLAGDNPKLTAVTIPYVPGTPVENYGRAVFGPSGKFLGTIDDPNFVDRDKFKYAARVNPSLYVGCVAWLKKVIPKLRPVAKKDGYPSERLMQSLIPKACKTNGIACVEVDDHEQAYGVNKLPELRLARQIYARRQQLACRA
jgi:bifunctional N-acetylglucosamine-1-phosphate-uridyltransferase/glucosamine-1-phosphate-acetyltransferase GlmU-like protein